MNSRVKQAFPRRVTAPRKKARIRAVRILSFVGTRPEIIKNLAFARAAARNKSLDLRIWHTGQNFGDNMADGIWKELGIPVERTALSVDRSTQGAVARSLMDFIAQGITEVRPDAVISNTDTDTAFYAALVAARMKVPVAHVEGGIRCEARNNPEEINRRLADHLSDIVFTISNEDTKSLISEGFDKRNVFMLGDITLDALQITLKEHGIKVESGAYDLLTVHRQENTGNPQRLRAILEGVAAAGFRTLFPVHPRTRQALERPELKSVVAAAKNIELLEPQTYIAMTRLSAGCRKIISDSGGLRREGYMLGKPVISLVWFVWFKSMNRLGFEAVADADAKKIWKAISSFEPKGRRPPLFGDGRAGEKILNRIALCLK